MADPLIVLEKESGVSCFPFRNDRTQPSMLERLYRAFPEQQSRVWPEGFEGGIAHRLDVSTSGQLLVAKSLSDLEDLRADFQSKALLKRYRFLTSKKVSWKQNDIGLAIAHHPKNRRKMIVQRGQNTAHRGNWYPAHTHFQHLASAEGLHLWEATMRSGVMHQIRIHAAFVGLALIGDSLYGGGESPSFFPADFALHHCGIESPKWNVSPVPVPDWWPDWAKSMDVSRLHK